jgi:hypothetical protein
MHDVRVSDPQVRLLRDDVAILAYKVHEDLTVESKAVTLDAADASTWVRRNEGWICALHTESILGDPFGRDRPASNRREALRILNEGEPCQVVVDSSLLSRASAGPRWIRW